MYDACGMGTCSNETCDVTAARASRNACRRQRLADTPPAVQDLMLTQMFNEFNADSDDVISRAELETLIGGCEGTTLSENEWNRLLALIPVVDRDAGLTVS